MYREQSDEERSILVLASRGRVQGIDRRTGELRWERVVTEEVERYAGQFSVELWITTNRIYAMSWMSNELVCLEYPSGNELGRVRVPLSSDGRPMILVDGDQLFIARNGKAAALTLDGQLQWIQDFGDLGGGRAPTAVGLPHNVRQADDRYER